MPEIKTVAIVANPYAEPQFVEQVRQGITDNGMLITDDQNSADIIFSIGGDGTFLGTAAKVGATGVPILGINSGHLGFLADVSPSDLSDSILAVAQGKFILEPRAVIEVETSGDPFNGYPFALNEVAILKQDNSSLIQIETYINGQLLNGYLADGLIVATPTGSTGYSLSVGGPIVMPDSHTLCLSAVAPHSLNVRPVIVRDDVEITLKIHSRSEHFLLAVDGRSQSLGSHTTLRIRKAAHQVNVAKICHPNLFDTLREKMQWGINSR